MTWSKLKWRAVHQNACITNLPKLRNWTHQFTDLAIHTQQRLLSLTLKFKSKDGLSNAHENGFLNFPF